MSRLQTQDARLTRTSSGLRTQIGIQPQRISPSQSGKVSELIQGLAAAGGALTSLKVQEEAKRDKAKAEQRRELYNSTVSRLTLLEDRLNNDPEFDKNLYLREYQSAINVFGEESDEGVTLRRQFMSNPEVDSFVRKREQLQLDAIQGAYVRSADRQVVSYNTQEEIARLAPLEAPQAIDLVFNELLSAYSDEDLEVMTQETQDTILKAAEEAVAFSRPSHKDFIKLNERNVSDAAYRSMLSRQFQLESFSLEQIREHADATQTPIQSTLDTFVTDASSRLATVISTGTPEEINAETVRLVQLRDSLAIYPEQQKLLTKELDSVYSKYAEDIGTVFTDMSIDSFQDLQTKEQAELTVNQSAVASFEEVVGREVDVDRPEDIVPMNDLEKTFKEGLVEAKNNAMREFDNNLSGLQEANKVSFDPNNSTREETRDLIDLPDTERVAFLEQRIDTLVRAESEGPINEEVADLIGLLDQAKTDNGAWSEVMGRVFSNSLNFGVARDKIVSDNLNIQNISDAGVRNTIAFLGTDPDLAISTLTDKGQIYALSRTMADASSDPNVDLGDTYLGHYDFYNSIKFDAGSETDVNLASVLSTPKFSEEFLGTSNVQLSSRAASTLLTLVDASTISVDPLSGAGIRAIKQRVQDSGYFVVTQQVGDGIGVAQIVNHPTIPERVFDNMDLFNEAINTPTTPLSRLLGNMISPNSNQDIFDIAIDTARNDTSAFAVPELSSLVNREQFFQLMDRGIITFSIDSANATSTGAPVVMLYTGSQGQPPRKYRLGDVNFGSTIYEFGGNGNYFRNLPPSYFKPERTRPSQNDIRVQNAIGIGIGF